MVQIRRIKFFKPRYAVTDSGGGVTEWSGRFGREGATTEIDGEQYAVRKDGRKRFVLEAGGRELTAADRLKRSERSWRISMDGAEYELARASMWRSRFELRLAGQPLGEISRKRRNVMCDLPDDFPVPVQAFLGFVAMAVWDREAAASSGGSVAATS